MRLVFINYIHPLYRHISAVRVSRFAEELAKRGHHVILLTKTLRDGDPGTKISEVSEMIKIHDWSSPLHIECAPAKMPGLQRLREQKSSSRHKKLRVCYEYAFHGGMFYDWAMGVTPYGEIIAKTFRPAATWGTFGNPDTLWVCRNISKQASAAWCIDVKDNWERFVPPPFRRRLSRRLAAADALTANSVFHGKIAERWIGRPFTTVYSGIDISEQRLRVTSRKSDDESRRAGLQEHGNVGAHDLSHGFRPNGQTLFIGGSIYNEDHFITLLDGITEWWRHHPAWQNRFMFSYAGCDGERVDRILSHRRVPFPYDIVAYQPHAVYDKCCREAMANAYVSSPHTFHHKAIELLGAGRPVLVIPGEHQETRDIAERIGGELLVCRTADDVATAMGRLTSDAVKMRRRFSDGIERFSWDAQTDILERALIEAVVNSSRNHVPKGLVVGASQSKNVNCIGGLHRSASS
jgi:hypothetical protein